jgi:hypothetical protein
VTSIAALLPGAQGRPIPVSPPHPAVDREAIGLIRAAAAAIAGNLAVPTNQPSENAARNAATEMGRTARTGNSDARAHCEVVVIFHKKCAASTIDPEAGTRAPARALVQGNKRLTAKRLHNSASDVRKHRSTSIYSTIYLVIGQSIKRESDFLVIWLVIFGAA